MNSITIIDASGKLIEYDMNAYGSGTICLGRSQENDICLHDDLVGRRQGQLFLYNGQWYYRDLKSTNGTNVITNGQRALLHQTDDAVPVFNGTILRMGSRQYSQRQVLVLISMNDLPKGWRNYPLTDQPVHLVFNAQGQIRLGTQYYPTSPCSIFCYGSEYAVNHNDPNCPVLINGQPVEQSSPLRDKDILQVGNSLLLFAGGSLFYKSESAGLALRARGVTKLVRGSHGTRKAILQDVSLDIQPNEFVAIIGGSGAGKTTVMNALSCFEPEFSGLVEAGGIDLKKNFDRLKSIIGFVPQQDILYENLTLNKMLMNAARLRMPKGTSRQQARARISQVLQMVELSSHADTLISKLSGGQKKRASIAVELLSAPRIFFLDEPSSGLDPGTEKSLMIMLNHMAKEQSKTIVMVTHNVSNLELCDQVIFMEPGGRLAFEGPVQEAREFFRVSDLTDIYNELSDDKNGLCARRFAQCRQLDFHRTDSSQATGIPAKKVRDSSFRQYGIFLDRYFAILLRDPKKLAMLLAMPVLIAVLLWIVSCDGVFSNYNDTKSMLFSLSSSAIWIGLFNTIQEICKERVIVRREYMSRLKLCPYLMAKFTISALLGLVQAILLGSLYCLLMGDLPEGIFFSSSAVEIVITLWLTILASEAMGFVVSSVARSGDKAMTYAPILLIVQLLFSGILFAMEGFSKVLSWFTVSKWSVEALGSSVNLNAMKTLMEIDYPQIPIERELEEIFEHSAAHLMQEWGVLLLMTAAFLILTLVLLRGIRKDRR